MIDPRTTEIHRWFTESFDTVNLWEAEAILDELV
jgi:hypothetical protein